MSNIFNNFISQVLEGDTLRDWQHASKLFVASNYALAPKNTFLYHVFFDLNSAARQLNNVRDSIKQTELGMLVKQISLPDFAIDTKTLNAYNRAHIVQTKIKYNPINIQFHDDSANVVRNFWFDYYNQYYRDADYGGSQDLSIPTSTHDEITAHRQQKDWGYTIRGTTTGRNISQPYLNAIRIYSLFNKQFSEYILINPIVKSFRHGEHNSAGTDPLAATMMVEYESVLYAYGRVLPGNVRGFGDLHYDKGPSPLTPAGGGTESILGPGGIVQSIGEVGSDLATGNFGAALFKGARVTNGLKGADLGSMLLPEALSLGKNIMTGNNPFGQIAVPGIGNMFSNSSKMGNGVNNLQTGGTSRQGIGLASTGIGGVAGLSGVIASAENLIEETVSGVTNFVTQMPQNLISAFTPADSLEDARFADPYKNTPDYSNSGFDE